MDRRNFVKTGMTSSLALGLGGNGYVTNESEPPNSLVLGFNLKFSSLTIIAC